MADTLVRAAVRGQRMCRSSKSSRRWRLIDRADASRASPGMEFRLRGEWGEPTAAGRVQHVRALHLSAWAEFELDADFIGPVSAYDLRSLWRSIRLQLSTGQVLLENLEGRQILDDHYFRTGAQANLVNRLHFGVQGGVQPEITHDMGIEEGAQGTVRVPISLTIHLADPSPMSGRAALRDIVPTRLLQGDGDTGLSIQLASQLPGHITGAKLTGIFAGAREGARRGIDVWAEVVELPGAVAKSFSRLVQWTDTMQSGTLKGLPPAARIIYCALRYLPEDALQMGQVESPINAHSAITVEADGVLYIPAYSPEDAATQTLLEEWSRLGAERLNNAALSLPLFDKEGMQALYLLPPRDRQAAPVAPISYSFQRSGGVPFSRYLARVVEPVTPELAARTAKALEDQCGCAPQLLPGAGDLTTDPYEPAFVPTRESVKSA